MINEKRKRFNRDLFRWRVNSLYARLSKSGVIKPFNDEFYAQFDGMLYDVIPVDYYLQTMNMGRCFDASAVLGLAFGKSEDVFIARGNLDYAGLAIYGTRKFVHGWVEKDGMVYDTTWKIIMPKKSYYKLFGAKCEDLRTTKQFFEDCEKLSDFNIHDKAYYENNYVPLAYPTLIQMLHAGKQDIAMASTEEKRKRGEKLLRDLPNLDKVCGGYRRATDQMMENAI